MSRWPSYHLPHLSRLSMHLVAEIRDLNYSNPSLFVYWPSIVCSQAAAPSVSPPYSLFSPRSGATRSTREDACCLNIRRLPLPSRRARFRAAIPQSPPSPPTPAVAPDPIRQSVPLLRATGTIAAAGHFDLGLIGSASADGSRRRGDLTAAVLVRIGARRRR